MMGSMCFVLAGDMEICSRLRPRFGVNASFCLLVCLPPLAARITVTANSAGRVTGRITDPQGAAVSGAQIKITDQRKVTLCETKTDPQGYFVCIGIRAGHLAVTAAAPRFAPVSTVVRVAPGEAAQVNLQFLALASQMQAVTVVASAPSVLTLDPAERVVVHDQVLDANPGRPGAPISIPGLPIETASGGIKAPQYFAPGVAGDHGEPIAQFFRVGNYLYPNNLPANAHGNGYADPNFLMASAINAVEVDSGAFNVREGNNAVNLATTYEPKERLNRFAQLTGDYRDFDLATGWNPKSPLEEASTRACDKIGTVLFFSTAS